MAAGNIIIPNNTITPELMRKISGEVEKLISSNAKDPGQWPAVSNLSGITSLPVLQQSGTSYKLVRATMAELKAETKINLVEDACKAATDAATNANSKAALANTAATNANTAKANADKATAAANTAAANAQAKADLANTAATNANDKAALANEKATAADIAAGRVNEAITQANTAATNAQQQAETAGDAATEAAESVTKINAALARMEELEATLTAKDRKQPTGMTLIYPERITMGNMEAKFVRAELTPAGTGGNVLFLGDDRAVSISPDGFIRTNAPGKSLVHVIPTENTAIYRTIEIQVIAPAIRKVSGVMRLLSGGRIRKM